MLASPDETPLLPVPRPLLLQVGEHLDQLQLHFEQLAAVVTRLARLSPAGPGAQTSPEVLASLSDQAERLRQEQERLDRLLRQHCRSQPVRLSQLILTGTDRAELDQRRGRVRAAAARTLGVLRGTNAALAVWDGVLQAALEALLGTRPREITYSASGTRAATTRPVILETRS